MTNTPLFSVLIANYNNGRFLQEAIDSVMTQTYSHWEIVLVDDKSTDNSYEIYDKYRNDPRFHIFYNEENKGCGYTKRRCAELAKGEICGFLDPDDKLLPNALNVSIKGLTSNPSAVLSFSRSYYCNEKMEILRESRELKMDRDESYLEHGDYNPESFAAFLRSAYLKTEGINPYLKAGVDQDLYFRVEEFGSIVVQNDFTYMYRLCQNSVSSDSDYALFWNYKVRFDAYERRNLLMAKDSMLYKAFCDRLSESELIGMEKVRASKAYRLGRFLLKPFSWLKQR